MRRSVVVPSLAFVATLACQDPGAPMARLVPPPCPEPAPLLGEPDPRAPGYIVLYQDDVDARQETGRLADRFGFEPTHVYEFALRGFSAELTPPVVASIWREASVRFVEHDSAVSIDGGVE